MQLNNLVSNDLYNFNCQMNQGYVNLPFINMEDKDSNRNLLLKYAGLGTQLCISMGLTLYIGMWADKKLHFPYPLLVWILPLTILVVILTKLIKDTSSKK